jgi:hypothetical protein
LPYATHRRLPFYGISVLLPRGICNTTSHGIGFASLSFSILLLTWAGSEENLLKTQHPGTAEPFRIAPAKPVAYTSLVTRRLADTLCRRGYRIGRQKVL